MYFNFKQDNITGKNGEQKIINFFESKNWKLKETAEDKKFPDWDAIMLNDTGQEIKLEIKTDIYPEDTGNLVIELSCNRKLCGIHTTKADKYCYLYDLYGELWVCDVSWLKQLLNEEQQQGILDIRNIGDNKSIRAWMVKRHKYKEHFDVYKV